MSFFFYILFFIFGLCAGSFLNVLIYRLPKDEKIIGYSHCPYCKTRLKWFDLIPILSFIFLRGKCRFCRKPISWQYPIVETATGLLFLLTLQLCNPIREKFSNGVNLQLTTGDLQNLLILGCLLFVVSCLLVIFMTDLKHLFVPDEIIYPAIFVAFLYQLLKITNYELRITNYDNLINSLLSGLFAAGFFLFFVLISGGRWMGMGDVKIAGFMGVMLSFPNVLIALLLAFISGSIIGLALVLAKKKTLKSQIPFGCFLTPSAFIAMFWGREIIEWYMRL